MLLKIKEFNLNTIGKIFAYAIIGILLIFTLFAELIANDLPIFVQTKNGWQLSAYNTNFELQQKEIKQQVYALVPFSASQQNFYHRNLAPFSENHLLGTDNLGRDVLANVIYGSRTSVILAFSAILLASFVGFLFGCSAGYFGDNSLQIKMVDLILIIVMIFIFYYYILYLSDPPLRYVVFLVLNMIIIVPRIFFHNRIADMAKINLPVDFLVVKIIEVVNSIPGIFIILALAAFLPPSVFSLIILIGLTGWTGIAKLARAETLKIKNMDYIESAKAMGAGFWRIVLVQVFPNIITSLMVAFSFSLAGAIILESTLSFLGVGLPPGTPSWGSMLANYKYNLNAWWLALFPGIAILLTVFCIHKIGDQVEKQLTKI